MLMISVRDIQKIEGERNKIRKDTFREILNQFDKQIKFAVEVGNKQVFLRVPRMLVGFPLYDMKTAVPYLERQLKLLGYDTRLLGGPNIYISWAKKIHVKEEPAQEYIDGDTFFPTLVNLKKVASEIRAKNNQ